MKLVKVLKFSLLFDLKLIFFLKWKYLFLNLSFGNFKIYLPNLFFFSELNKNFSIIFIKKVDFFYFFKQFLNLLKCFFKNFFFRLKLKGLGLRIKKMVINDIYRFFFGFNHYFYFFLPRDIYIFKKKRNFLVLSKDKVKLNNVFVNLLLLRKLNFYERTNSFILPKRIIFIKK